VVIGSLILPAKNAQLKNGAPKLEHLKTLRILGAEILVRNGWRLPVFAMLRRGRVLCAKGARSRSVCAHAGNARSRGVRSCWSLIIPPGGETPRLFGAGPALRAAWSPRCGASAARPLRLMAWIFTNG
jgi:hypothetical protein